MAARYNTNDINKLSNREFFFDTNILLYLYYPTYTSKGWEVNTYSNLFSKLLKSKAKLIIDSHVLSEFINSILRIEYKNFKDATSSNIDYKPYRKSADGQNAVNSTYGIVKGILKQFEVEVNNLSKITIEPLLTLDSLDFNDKIIEKHCLDKGYILVTNDTDFKSSSADILTANRNF